MTIPGNIGSVRQVLAWVISSAAPGRARVITFTAAIIVLAIITLMAFTSGLGFRHRRILYDYPGGQRSYGTEWCSVEDELRVDAQPFRGVLLQDCLSLLVPLPLNCYPSRHEMFSPLGFVSKEYKPTIITIESFGFIAGAEAIPATGIRIALPHREPRAEPLPFRFKLESLSATLIEFYFPIRGLAASGEMVMRGLIETSDSGQRTFECRKPVSRYDSGWKWSLVDDAE